VVQDVNELLSKVLELEKLRFEQQKIQVIRQGFADLPEVTVDAEQLKQVFVNLINNAVEAMPRGGTLRVETSSTRRGDRDMVVVQLSDTGPGMPEDVKERVFEPFFTTKPEGTGLGMCIAASVMARHGGALVLDKSNSYGTQWSVWIPLTAAT
jgi:signal transduction histidine kinase